MRPDKAGAMRVSGFQGEFHARADIGRRPVGISICLHSGKRAGEGAVRIGVARQNMALVEMRVHIDEAGPDLPMIEIERR